MMKKDSASYRMLKKFKRAYDAVFFLPLERYRNYQNLKHLVPLYKNKVVLDCGCGHGEMTYTLAKDAKLVYGIDIDPDSLRRAGEPLRGNQKPNIVYKTGDARRIPFSDNFFDFVFCSEVIEHVKNYGRVFKEISRVLKKGGKAYFTTPYKPMQEREYESYDDETKKKYLRWLKNVGHVRFGFDEEEITKAAKKTNFKVLRFEYAIKNWVNIKYYEFGLKMSDRWFWEIIGPALAPLETLYCLIFARNEVSTPGTGLGMRALLEKK
ncbi:MAG: class I SAM-dependent methyltransferase [Candidatus Micrarchaeota archaeon]